MFGHQPTEELVKKRAYQLWKEAGRPFCDSNKFWFQAEKEINEAVQAQSSLKNIEISIQEHKLFTGRKMANEHHERLVARTDIEMDSYIGISKEQINDALQKGVEERHAMLEATK